MIGSEEKSGGGRGRSRGRARSWSVQRFAHPRQSYCRCTFSKFNIKTTLSVTDHSTRPATTRHTNRSLASVNTFAILKICRCRVFVVNRCFCDCLEFQIGYFISTKNSPSVVFEMVSKSMLVFKYKYSTETRICLRLLYYFNFSMRLVYT